MFSDLSRLNCAGSVVSESKITKYTPPWNDKLYSLETCLEILTLLCCSMLQSPSIQHQELHSVTYALNYETPGQDGESCANLSRRPFLHEGNCYSWVLQHSTRTLGTLTYCTASIVWVALQFRCSPLGLLTADTNATSVGTTCWWFVFTIFCFCLCFYRS